MGALKSGDDQKQGKFKKANQWWQKDGDVVFRILPASDLYTDNGNKWNQYHAVVKGYKNVDGKLRMFESTLRKENKVVVVKDAAVERFESLKAAYEKARSESNGAVAAQLNALIGMQGVYSIEKKWHMNVMNLEGAVGTFALNYTAKSALEAEMTRLKKEGVDPLSLENGRYFIFSKSNTGGKASYSVRVLQKEVEIQGKKFKEDVVSSITSEQWDRIELEMVDLDSLYIKITPEEVAQIVEESDLKTGKSPACNRIFDDRWKAKRSANAAPTTSQTTSAASSVAQTPAPTQSASTATPPATQPQTTAPAQAAPKAQDRVIDDLSDDEFFKMIGVPTSA